ncbi:MAG TPA: N-acetylglutamate synthase [Lentisphaeria bacterium]|jgi:amino-acid N-acetyltransferase|nr:N-acetylglutamate synthase [Lentisphaeria bacterium]|tara:strand:- start:6643 stop:7053 length:411 start_codon:yes stop_codon:yes gene_type:complete
MNDDTTIRAATDADIEGIEALLAPFVSERQLLDRTDKQLLYLAENGFVAVCGERIIGFAAIEVYSRKLAEIQALGVSAEFQGQGIGQALVEHCVERAKELKVVELMAITASESVFRSCGFDFALPDQKRAVFLKFE